MRSDKAQRVQVFWATTLRRMSEESSLGVDISGDGKFHEYQLDLGQSPSWRGVIVALRIDPATEPGVKFAIDYVRLQ